MRVLFVLAVACGIATPASATPSFDCSKASNPVETAICSDPALAALDQKLAATYATASAQLPGPERTSLREGQRQWLEFVRIVCGEANNHAVANCLTSRYSERVKQLGFAVTLAGGIRFYRADIFKARRSQSVDPADGPAFETLESSYPQIVTPMTPSQEGFNKKLAAIARDEASDFDEGGADIAFGYDDIDVSGTLISVNTTSSLYGHGAAHPMYSGSVIHWLREEGREMTAEDVFAKGSAWRAFLREFCFKAVKREGFVETPEDLSDLPEDPQRWLLSKIGLTVRFNPYEVASYAEGMQEVTIPWSMLKPYLAETAPVP